MGLLSICTTCKQKIVSCVIDLSVSVTWRFDNLSRTENGRALCCFSLGLAFLKAQNYLDRRMLSSLSASSVGFCLPGNQRYCTIFDMVSLTVPSASVLKRELENLPLLTAMAKAPSRRILSWLLRLFMKMTWHPTERQYSFHLVQAHDLLSCIPSLTARSQAR